MTALSCVGAWVSARWAKILIWASVALSFVAVLFAAVLRRRPGAQPDPDVLNDWNAAQVDLATNEADRLNEQRAGITTRIDAIADQTARDGKKIQGESMEDLAERWNR